MRRLLLYLVPVLACLGGLLLAHHEMILSGLAFIQNDPGDTRFCNYALEHGYRWLFGWPSAQDLWSPGFFYPVKETFAYTENLLGVMPLYALWRVVGFRVDTAFQLWILSLGALNFASAYLLFRRCFSLGQVAGAVGAGLFAFAAIRINQTMHYQVFPHFFSVVAVHAAYRLFAGELEALTEKQRITWIAVFAAAVTGQLYASIYMGWYLAFALSLAILLALPFATARRRAFRLVAAHPFTLLLAAGLSATVLAPLMLRYLEVGKQFGYRPFGEVLTMIPVAKAWFHLGGYSWFYAGLGKTQLFAGIPMEHEQRLGFGLLTTALCGLGLTFGRKVPGVRMMSLFLGAMLALTTLFGGFTLWKYVYEYFPGAQAIRAVSRIGILLLVPIGLGVALAVQRLMEKGLRGAVAAIALGGMALLEQGETTPAFDKAQAREDIDTIASQVGKECEAFLFSPVQGYGPYWKYQLDAMMASLQAGVPTLNGYSGHDPEGWPFTDTNLRSREHEARLNQLLGYWVGQKKLDPKRLCWVRTPLQEGPYRAVFVSQSVPATMIAGQRYEVALTLRNTGEDVWTRQADFRLGAQSPQDNELWGRNRVELEKEVPPGQAATFRFPVTAPPTPGRHAFQWRMVREHVRWFGASTEPVAVEVSLP